MWHLKSKRLSCRNHLAGPLIVRRLLTSSYTSTNSSWTTSCSNRCQLSLWARLPRFQMNFEMMWWKIIIRSLSSRNAIELRRSVKILNSGIIASAKTKKQISLNLTKSFTRPFSTSQLTSKQRNWSCLVTGFSSTSRALKSWVRQTGVSEESLQTRIALFTSQSLRMEDSSQRS